MAGVRARLSGVMGLRPLVRVTGVTDHPQAFGYHGAPWQASRRGMWSVDGESWQCFDSTRVVGSTVEMRNNAPFPADTIYVGRGRQMSVSACGRWLRAPGCGIPDNRAIGAQRGSVRSVGCAQCVPCAVVHRGRILATARRRADDTGHAVLCRADPRHQHDACGRRPKRVAVLVGGFTRARIMRTTCSRQSCRRRLPTRQQLGHCVASSGFSFTRC